MTALAGQLAGYLQARRALGFKLARHESLLASFVAFAEAAGAEHVTTQLALEWATLPAGADPYWHAARLGYVRVLARYLHAADPRHEIPPRGILPARACRADPYLYQDAEITAVMAAAGSIRQPLRAATYRTLTGLLAVTGMRIGEVIGLDRGDIDFEDPAVIIRNGKGGSSRRLPVHPGTAGALGEYASVRDACFPALSGTLLPALTPAFFVSLRCTRLIYSNVHQVFRDLVRAAGLQPRSQRCRPRIHDLRHTFAVRTQMGRIASDASFGILRERALPAAQRAA